ncbi:MAG: HAD family phosphatase [Ruminococcus sp.]|nr:HAD family phosphatase [Ruminococcus sp.]
MYSFKGYIFDLDGTLVESAHVWHQVDKEFLARRGFEVPEDYCRALAVMDFNMAAVYTKERFGLPDSLEEIKDEWFSLALDEYTNRIRTKPHAAEFLRSLKERGKRIALATASNVLLYSAVLKSNGIYDLFDAFVSTEEAPRGKGFPDVYELAASRLGLSAGECVVFEDIIEGIRGANAGGFATAAVLGGSYPEDEAAMQREAAVAFSDFAQITKNDDR